MCDQFPIEHHDIPQLFQQKITIEQAKLFSYACLLLAFVVIVFPNSLRIISLPLFPITALLAVLSTKHIIINTRLFIIWLSTSFVTLIFLEVGFLNGHNYTDAMAQVLFVYIISPALWLIITAKLLNLYSSQQLIHIIIGLGVLGAFSVFAFYYVFSYKLFFPDYVRIDIALIRAHRAAHNDKCIEFFCIRNCFVFKLYDLIGYIIFSEKIPDSSRPFCPYLIQN